MSNYAPDTPRDAGGMPKDGYPPAKTAVQRTTDENASTSSIMLLSHNTTEIEVCAVNQHVAGKWISQANLNASVAGTSVITAAGTENWDFIVQSNTVHRYVVPRSTQVSNYGSMMGVNRREGLFPAVAFKTTAGNGSVLTAEF